jgi:adenylylsulfate kinase
MEDNQIHPIFDKILSRYEREKRLNQKSKVLWFTGLSGSGKSTLAEFLEKKMFDEGFIVQVLDGDNIRSGINKNLSFTDEDRNENIRRIAEISKLYLNSGIITINSFISPTIESRKIARNIIGEDDFIEIFVNTPIEICEKRDVKGLYLKARNGLIKDFTGITSPYEIPESPSFEIKTEKLTVEESVEKLYKFISDKISFE